MKNKIISIKKLHKKYDKLSVLDNLSFDIYEGEIICIVGTSGCGKSTLLNILSGIDKSYEGSIDFKYNKDDIGYMFQEPSLFPWLTIHDNAKLTCKIKKIDNYEYVDDLLKRYLLYEFKDNYPQQLSGGMKQRLSLIRTISSKPKILFLDEPFGALDYQTRLSISTDVYNLIKENNITAIMVTHDISEAIKMADRIIVLSNRPSVIKNIYEIDKEINTYDENYIKYHKKICEDLNTDEK